MDVCLLVKISSCSNTVEGTAIIQTVSLITRYRSLCNLYIYNAYIHLGLGVYEPWNQFGYSKICQDNRSFKKARQEYNRDQSKKLADYLNIIFNVHIEALYYSIFGNVHRFVFKNGSDFLLKFN